MNEDFAFLLLFFGISVTANVFLVISAFRSSRRARRFERLLVPGSAGLPDDRRVERLEGAVEGLEERLDQLARGQEFLSKLVSERRHVPVVREREVTPV